MHILVRISTADEGRPPAGTAIDVQVRDTTFEDAPAEIIARSQGLVRDDPGTWLDTVEVEIPFLPDSSIVWVHVDVDRDGRVSVGDFITMVSYPVPSDSGTEVSVVVRRV